MNQQGSYLLRNLQKQWKKQLEMHRDTRKSSTSHNMTRIGETTQKSQT
jgi:hypothetical protein